MGSDCFNSWCLHIFFTSIAEHSRIFRLSVCVGFLTDLLLLLLLWGTPILVIMVRHDHMHTEDRISCDVTLLRLFNMKQMYHMNEYLPQRVCQNDSHVKNCCLFQSVLDVTSRLRKKVEVLLVPSLRMKVRCKEVVLVYN